MRREKGVGLINAIGALLVTLMVGAFSIDSGLYMSMNQGMKNAADAAALAGAMELFKNTSSSAVVRQSAARASAQSYAQQNMGFQLNDNDIEFGYVDPITGQYDPNTFLTPTANTVFASTGGYNAVRVRLRAAQGEANGQIPTFLGQYFGKTGLDSEANAIAIYGGGINSSSGLRPIYLCQEAYDKALELYGDPTVPLIRFYGSTLSVGGTTVNQANSCGSMGPGNWGLADFDGNGGGQNQVNYNLYNGYPGTVTVGQNYGPKPGNSLNSSNSELTYLRDNQVIITLPLYDSTSGNGNNAKFHVSMLAPFKITGFQLNGNNTYVEGHFQKTVCHNGCSLGNAVNGGTATKIRLIH